MPCPKCKEPLPDGASMCPACGATLEVRLFSGTSDDTKTPTGSSDGTSTTPTETPAGSSDSATPVCTGSSDSALPAPTAPAGTKKSNRLFSIIGSSVCLRRILGVPYFEPPIRATTLFNAWAFLFGPFYYFFTGMWRKGIVLALLAGCISLPLFTNTDTEQLLYFLNEEYGTFSLSLSLLCTLIVLLYCMGRRFSACLAVAVFTIVFHCGELHLEPLDMGISSAFVWFNSDLVWEALFSIGFFSLMAQRFLSAVCFLIFALVTWQAGLPVSTLPPVLLPSLLAVLCGMMATYDRYRFRVGHQKFWW